MSKKTRCPGLYRSATQLRKSAEKTLRRCIKHQLYPCPQKAVYLLQQVIDGCKDSVALVRRDASPRACAAAREWVQGERYENQNAHMYIAEARNIRKLFLKMKSEER